MENSCILFDTSNNHSVFNESFQNQDIFSLVWVTMSALSLNMWILNSGVVNLNEDKLKWSYKSMYEFEDTLIEDNAFFRFRFKVF